MESKIQKLVEKALADLQFEDCFLIELKVNNTKVEVFIDSDESVSFEKCRKISRFMEEVLDEEQWLGEKYTLDVSSAGIGRPLMYSRQYKKNVGRNLEVSLLEGGKEKGKILGADDEKVTIEVDRKEKVGKKNIKKKEAIDIAYDAIKQAKIKVSF